MADKSKERLELEAQALSLGVAFQANIGDAKLAKRVKEATTDTKPVEGSAGATDDGSQSQAGAATEAAPAIPETRTQGGGLPEAQATAVQTNTETPEPLSGAQVSITGPKRGRWRAGFHFTAEPRLFTVSELTDDEIAAISLDDKLTVTPVE